MSRRRITRRRHRPARTSAAIILTPPAGIMIGLTVLAIARHPRARRNGWAPPADANAVMAISEECADGACVLCPGTGCYCPCQHDSYVIAAMNTARASQAAPQTAPAAETPPF